MPMPPTPVLPEDVAPFQIYLAAKGLSLLALDAWELAHYTRSFYTWLTVRALLPRQEKGGRREHAPESQ